MKRISRIQSQFDLIRQLDQYAKASGISIQNPKSQVAFLAALVAGFQKQRTDGILVHGLRVQAMFAYVAAGMGNCAAIKEEDAGEIYCQDDTLAAPDFRVVMLNGEEILVEVKNHHPKEPGETYEVKADYLGRLERYAALFKRPLYLAIFWSQPKIWSLAQPKDFVRNGPNFELPLTTAMMKNKLGLLGDMMIGTTPSLSLKLYSDPAKPRAVGLDGLTPFTIGQVELLCGDRVLTDPKDREIAWFLMHYGNWTGGDSPAEVRDGLLVSTSITVAPEERANPDQLFESVGFLSQMLSRQFNAHTTADGQVTKLSPTEDPGTINVAIPADHKSEALPLWRFAYSPAPAGPMTPAS